jgi:hypothetical protein
LLAPSWLSNVDTSNATMITAPKRSNRFVSKPSAGDPSPVPEPRPIHAAIARREALVDDRSLRWMAVALTSTSLLDLRGLPGGR